jgi:hypothetical protein
MKKVTLPLEFVKEAHKAACNDWKKRIEEHVPELAEPKNDWYWWENNLLYYNNGEETYGFWDGKWCDNLAFSTLSGKIPATNKEVETALIAEAEKRGFKVGVKVKTVKGYVGTITNNHTPSFEAERNWFYYNNMMVFDNGKWAKKIENPIPKSLQKAIDKLGKEKILELLK